MLRGEELIDLSVPRLVETETAVTLGTTVETTVLTAIGHASACDVWFKLPTAWETVVTLRLYARVADARVLLKTVRIDESHRSTAGGFVSGTAISVRGRPVTSFELTAQSSTANVTNGQFMMNLWHSSEPPLVVGGITSAASQAAEERTVAHLAVRNGTTPVLAAGDASGRSLIAGPGVGGTPSGGVLTVQGHGAGGAITAIQGTAGAAAARWPVYLSDGTNPQGTTTNPLNSKAVRGGGAMYGLVSPAVVKVSLAAVGTAWLMTVRSVSPKRIEAQRIIVTYHGVAAGANADGRIIICRATADGSGPPPSPTKIVKFDSGDAASLATARLFSAATPLTLAAPLDLISLAVRGDMKDTFTFDADAWGKPIVLPAAGETLGIRFVVDTVVTAQFFWVSACVHWIEI